MVGRLPAICCLEGQERGEGCELVERLGQREVADGLNVGAVGIVRGGFLENA